MRKLSPHNAKVMIDNATSSVGHEFKSVESEMILIRADFREGKLKLIGGCCGLIRACAPSGGVKLTACPLEWVGKGRRKGLGIGGMPDIYFLKLGFAKFIVKFYAKAACGA